MDFFAQSAISVPVECLNFEEVRIIVEGWPVQLDVVPESTQLLSGVDVPLFVFLATEVALTLKIKRRPAYHFWVEHLDVPMFVCLSTEVALTLKIKRRPAHHFWVEHLSVCEIAQI